MTKNTLTVAVVGATGAVGRALLSILEERNFPVGELVPFASARSEGKPIRFAGREFKCRALKTGCFKGVDIAFFDASDAVSKEWVPQAADAGAWVVDNSGAFRMDSDIPLVVPEVNGGLLAARTRSGSTRERIVAGPNCSTVQLVVALEPIRARWGLRRVVVSSYQSVSGAGTAAMDELTTQTSGVLSKTPVAPNVFPHQIAFNCIPQIGGFSGALGAEGYTSEEQKIMLESRKILALPQLRITATAVRVPTYLSHCESVQIECDKPFEVAEVRSVLETADGVQVLDRPENSQYPMAITGAGQDPVFVGRLRRDISVENGLSLWVVSDNLRKGAALNAVQIGEVLVQR